MSILSNRNNFNLLAQKHKIELDRLKRNLNFIVFDCVVVAIASNYLYNKFLDKYAVAKNKKRCLDFIFVLGLTSVISHIHCQFIRKYDLKTLSDKYRYTLLNSISLDNKEIKCGARILNLMCDSDVKQIYLIVILTLRILI